MKNNSLKINKLKIIAFILSFCMAFNISSMEETEKVREKEEIQEKSEKRKNVFEDEQELSRAKSVKLDEEKSDFEKLPSELKTMIAKFGSGSVNTPKEVHETVKDIKSWALVSDQFAAIIQSPEFQKYLFELVKNNISKLLLTALEMGTQEWANRLKEFVERQSDEYKEKIQSMLNFILTYYSYLGKVDGVKFLLKVGANPNNIYSFPPSTLAKYPQDFDPTSALINAIKKGHLEVAKLLLKAGANPNFKSTYYYNRNIASANTALMQAVKNENKDAVEFLLNNGADPNISTIAVMPLIRAVRYNNREIVELLLDAQANTDYREIGTGETALMLAVRLKGRKEIVKLLLAAHANPDIQDNQGNTALIDAVRTRSGKEVVKLLLDAGADPSITNNSGQSALSIAEQKNNYEPVLQMLRKNIAAQALTSLS